MQPVLTFCVLSAMCVMANGQQARFVYAVNNGEATITSYGLDFSTGTLTLIGITPTGTSPIMPVVHPSGKFLYTLNRDSNNISVFEINAVNGALTSAASPFATGTGGPQFGVFDASGRFMYVTSLTSGVVTVFAVDGTTGALTNTGLQYAAGHRPTGVAIHPNDRFVYVISPVSLSVFERNLSTGALTQVGAAGGGFNLAVHPSGRFLYTVGGGLRGYTIANDGTLTVIPGAPATGEHSVAIHPAGTFLYTTFNGFWAYKVDPTSGAVSSVPGSPFVKGVAPYYAAIDPSGTFIYAGNYGSHDVSGFRIDATLGALTDVAGAPFKAGSHAHAVAFAGTTAATCTAQNATIYPTHGGNTGTVTVQILCPGVPSDAQVTLTGNGTDIVGYNITAINGVLTTSFNPEGAIPGPRTVVITNPDATSVSLPNAFTIEQGGAPDLRADIVGPDFIRIGREHKYFITLTNAGSADAGVYVASAAASTSVTLIPSRQFLLETRTTKDETVAVYLVPSVRVASLSGIPVGVLSNGTTSAFSLRVQKEPVTRPHLSTGGAKMTSVNRSAAMAPADQLPSLFRGSDIFDGCRQPSKACEICNAEWDAYNSRKDAALAAQADFQNSRTTWVIDGGQEVAKDIAYGLATSYAVSAFIAPIVTAILGETVAAAALTELIASLTLYFAETAPSFTDNPDGGLQKTSEMVLAVGERFVVLGKLQAELEQLPRNDPRRADLLTKFGKAVDALQVIQTILSSISSHWSEMKRLSENVSAAGERFTRSKLLLCSSVDVYEICARSCPEPRPPAPPASDVRPDDAIKRGTALGSYDPNDKAGPQGVGTGKFVASAVPVPYLIQFENKETATAPAEMVEITDQLDGTRLDLSTLTLGPIRFTDKVITPPSVPLSVFGTYTTTVDLRPAKDLLVKIMASLNTATGVLTWRFDALDPATGQPPAGVDGFLPPGGQGSVFFTVRAKEGLATDTQIRNTASIVFDTNAPIVTREWINTVDASAPTSKVTSLDPAQATPSFLVRWSGTDMGAGMASYDVLVSDNNGPFVAWQSRTTATQATYTGSPGHTYRFYSIATDLVGNVEGAKSAPEAITTVVLSQATTECTGCYFMSGNVRATVAFKVTAPGAASAFMYNYRTATQIVQFISTTTSAVQVSGNAATFSGQGTLNGQTGYNFSVTAKDGGPAGSGQDTVSILITGPNGYSHSASGTIAGGDITVK